MHCIVCADRCLTNISGACMTYIRCSYFCRNGTVSMVFLHLLLFGELLLCFIFPWCHHYHTDNLINFASS